MVIIVIIQYWFVCLFVFLPTIFIHSFIHQCPPFLLYNSIDFQKFFFRCCWFVHKHNLFSNFLIHNLFRLMNEWMNEYIWKRDRFPVVFFWQISIDYSILFPWSIHSLFRNILLLMHNSQIEWIGIFFSLWWISHQIMALFGAILCYLCVCVCMCFFLIHF